MHDIKGAIAAGVGALTGAAGALSADNVVQLISAISSLACLAYALIRAGIRTFIAVKKRKRGKITDDQLLDEVDQIHDELKGGPRNEK